MREKADRGGRRDDKKGNMADIANLVEELSKLTVIEAADLVKKLEEKWGVTAAAPVAVLLLRLPALLRLPLKRRPRLT